MTIVSDIVFVPSSRVSFSVLDIATALPSMLPAHHHSASSPSLKHITHPDRCADCRDRLLAMRERRLPARCGSAALSGSSTRTFACAILGIITLEGSVHSGLSRQPLPVAGRHPLRRTVCESRPPATFESVARMLQKQHRITIKRTYPTRMFTACQELRQARCLP